MAPHTRSRRRASIAAIALTAALTGAASAHYPEGQLFPVFQFTDDQVPVMDGDLSDWDIVPAAYWTGTSDLMETVRGLGTDFDEQDLAVETAVGWNDTHNRLYFVVRAHDDVVNMEHEGWGGIHGGDLWEVVVDGDHSGGIYNGFSSTDTVLENRHKSAHCQNYHAFLPPLSADYTVWLWGEAQWVCSPPYSQTGWSFEGEPEGRGTVHQEMSLTPFDDLNWVGIDSSRVHDLQEGEILGISWSFLDYDHDDGKYDGFWNLSHMTRMDHTADLLPDFVLLPVEPIPTAVEAEDRPARVERFSLAQNYPNPFNLHTTIGYQVAESGPVRLSVYTLTGQHVRTLVDSVHPVGSYSLVWTGDDASGRTVTSGVYLCRLQTGALEETRKLAVLK